MRNNYLRYSFLFVCLLCAFGCTDKSTDYPKLLTTAIENFYNENQNELILTDIEKVLATDPDVETKQVSLIFKAAALCESTQIDSACAIFKTIRPETLSKQSLFWYKSIEGLLLFRKNRFSEAYKVLLATTSSRHKDMKAIALNERILARISFILSDPYKGIDWIMTSTRHFEEAGLIKNTGVNMKILGRYYMRSRNYNKAILLFQKAEKIFAKYNDKAELFYIYINIIDYCLQTNQAKAALYYGKKCLTEFNDNMDNTMRALAYNNLGEIEIKLSNLESAAQYYTKTLQLPDNYSTYNVRRSNAHRKLSKIHLLNNNFKQAQQEILLAYKYLPDTGYFELRRETYFELAKSYKLVNNTEAAYAYLDTANMFLSNSYFSLTKNTDAYHDTKVELSETEEIIQKIKASKRLNQFLAFIIISVLNLFFILGFTIYRQQRSKNKVLTALVKKNMQLLEEERKLKLSQQQPQIKRNNTGKSSDIDMRQHLFDKLIKWLETDKNFTRKDLTLEIVCKELKTNREYLSRAISEQNLRFNDLINKYRVEEVIAILTNPNNRCSKYNLAVIGSQAGFGSNSVFIDAFHKQTGMNPAEFRKNTCENK
ncbi:MAG TPA: helix-turn-helix domain-containing protein [Paludibacter sp.]|nr:helix-turn-helix domain-containing protein [Paludibacter sp.]